MNDACIILYHRVSCLKRFDVEMNGFLQSSEITGASHGIGRALALQAAQLGAAELILVGSIDDVCA